MSRGYDIGYITATQEMCEQVTTLKARLAESEKLVAEVIHFVEYEIEYKEGMDYNRLHELEQKAKQQKGDSDEAVIYTTKNRIF